MRTALKMVLPLIVSVAVVSVLFAWYQVRTEKRALRNDLSRRAEILGESLQESVEPLLNRPPDKNLQRLVERFGEREHLKGVAVYDTDGKALAITPGIAAIFQNWPESVKDSVAKDAIRDEFVNEKRPDNGGNKTALALHIHAVPLRRSDASLVGALAVFHDTSYIDLQVSHTLRDSLLNALVQTILIAGLALVLVRWTFMKPLKHTAHWLRTMRTGAANGAKAPPGIPEGQGEIFDQLHQEVKHLARDLTTARATAEEEARLRETGASQWTAERLRVSLQTKLHETPLFVVSNREPYMHERNEKDGSIHV